MKHRYSIAMDFGYSVYRKWTGFCFFFFLNYAKKDQQWCFVRRWKQTVYFIDIANGLHNIHDGWNVKISIHSGLLLLIFVYTYERENRKERKLSKETPFWCLTIQLLGILCSMFVRHNLQGLSALSNHRSYLITVYSTHSALPIL